MNIRAEHKIVWNIELTEDEMAVIVTAIGRVQSNEVVKSLQDNKVSLVNNAADIVQDFYDSGCEALGW